MTDSTSAGAHPLTRRFVDFQELEAYAGVRKAEPGILPTSSSQGPLTVMVRERAAGRACTGVGFRVVSRVYRRRDGVFQASVLRLGDVLESVTPFHGARYSILCGGFWQPTYSLALPVALIHHTYRDVLIRVFPRDPTAEFVLVECVYGLLDCEARLLAADGDSRHRYLTPFADVHTDLARQSACVQRTAVYKRELMARACHPDRLAQT